MQLTLRLLQHKPDRENTNMASRCCSNERFFLPRSVCKYLNRNVNRKLQDLKLKYIVKTTISTTFQLMKLPRKLMLMNQLIDQILQEKRISVLIMNISIFNSVMEGGKK